MAQEGVLALVRRLVRPGENIHEVLPPARIVHVRGVREVTLPARKQNLVDKYYF